MTCQIPSSLISIAYPAVPRHFAVSQPKRTCNLVHASQLLLQPTTLSFTTTFSAASGRAPPRLHKKMATQELTIAQAALSASLFRADPTSLSRASVDAFFPLLSAAVTRCSRPNVQV